MNDDLQQILRAGIDAARRGDKDAAHRLLEQVVQQDPSNELALIWLASTVNTVSERRDYLERVLEINPNNQRAQEALRRLGGSSSQRTAASDAARVEQVRQQQRRQTQTPRSPRSPASRIARNQRLLIGVVILGVIGLVLGSTILNQRSSGNNSGGPIGLVPTLTASNTPDPNSPTPSITPTSSFSLATTRTNPTLPPTFTPKPTNTPMPTSTPTSTPYPLSEFEALYTSRDPLDTQPGLYVIQGDGGNEQKLVDDVTDIVYDPGGERVAFIREVTYPPEEGSEESSMVTEIFVAPAQSPQDAEKVTNLRIASAHSPTFSPDGQQIVFVSSWDGDDELWLLDLNSGITQQLTCNTGVIDKDPAWSPDGSHLVFASDLDSPGFTEIYRLTFIIQEDSVCDLETGSSHTIERMTDDQGSSFSPAWSLNGAWITFVNDREGDSDIFIMDADGQRRRILTLDEGAEDRSPTFTPNGRMVAFVSNREDERFQIYLVDVDSRDVIRLINNEREADSISYKPELIFRFQDN